LLLALCRNGIVISPHVRATNATIAAARIVRDAAEKAGAPKGLIQWIEHPSHALATALMKDPGINLILATGGPAMVRAAYESGHPSIGVGAGNTPAVIDDTADIEMVRGAWVIWGIVMRTYSVDEHVVAGKVEAECSKQPRCCHLSIKICLKCADLMWWTG
jgi:acyl-CoA reductase-like NAD-dependent aldehyde dehydrogenase